ncbi:hypothetical protein HYH03_009736 [Edaphochlamys debaryana]|uniref:Cytochrome P450 n=1 Tax=Edaphochlamys debaryana TaxID=47281 RepID=A0A835Y0U2_9CHLO|nr:hypothetical protein HYH03_009736 [Edaphochlamys debaryana]|eukprot:KAG2492006.1 hypothetical protein HYH03_009736 [Edaphochlamys debaryana]
MEPLALLLLGLKWLGWSILALVAIELLLSLELYKRWRLRHIPGPPAPPIVGHLPQIIRQGTPTFFRACRKQYGPVFKVCLGRSWMVVVTEPELLRQAGSKLLNHSQFRGLLSGEFQKLDDWGLVSARDDYWRLVRSSWQPAFSSASLSGYLPRMLDCAEALAGRLAGRAAGAGRVDLWRELGAMTLQVVGSTAYGVDFNTTDGSDEADAGGPEGAGAGGEGADQHFGRVLVAACRDTFKYMSIRNGSKYGRVGVLLPELRPLVSALAHAFPDPPFAGLLKARADLRDVCMHLIASWRERGGADAVNGKQANGHGPEANGGDAKAGNGVLTNGGAKGAGDVPGGDPPAPSVSPGSFLGLMLAARDKATGQGLTDLQVAAQVQTFILAGYETTANALSFAVYCLATNPEAEARLISEVDSVLGPDRLPTEADLPRLVYTEAVFQEAMRLFPPAPGTNRGVEKGAPYQVGPYSVPPGVSLMMSMYSSHHADDVWPRVDDFVPERFMPTSPLYPEVCAKVPGAHAPFGYGSRMCVGWKFAMQEAKATLAVLYQRLRFELEPGQVPLQLAVGITMAPKGGLLFTATMEPLALLLLGLKWFGWSILALVGIELLLSLDLYQRWRLRHIPGPPAPPILGHLPQIIRLGTPTFFRQCRKIYGPVFKVALGRSWMVVVTEPELLKQVGAKIHNRYAFDGLMRGEFKQLDDWGLVAARDDYWRLVRSSWQPAFSSASLSGYLPRMLDCAEALAGRLAGRAAGAGRVDLWRELGAMTLQVVGSTAYGVDFHTAEDPEEADDTPAPLVAAGKGPAGQDDKQFGRALVAACRDVFKFASIRNASKYGVIAILFPELRRPLTALAHSLPDRPFSGILRARADLRNACMYLISSWREGGSARALNGPEANGGDAKAGNGVLTNGGAKGAGDVPGGNPPAPSVSPGSFLGLMLAARDKATGQGLTDLQVAAQVQTFLLAGYETTANALSFAVYCLATNPEAEARLIAEVDSVLGPDRLPTEADLPRLAYTEAVFQESMRLFPPAPGINREVEKGAPFQVGPYSVPPGSQIMMSMYSSHHADDVWPRVDDFVPERFMPTSPLYPEVCAKVPGAHAPFGYGSRFCVGWKFAMQEAKAALAVLYQRLRFELEPGQVPLQLSVGITMSPKGGLWVRPVLRRQQTAA